MSVTWQVPALVKDPYVVIGDSPDSFGHRIPAELEALSTPATNVNESAQQYYLRAALDNLDPGRTYYYAVGHQGFDPVLQPGGLSAIASFTTGPARGQAREPFTFTAFGDQGEGYDGIVNDARVLGQRPAFHLHAGDISYSGGGSGLITDTFDPRLWDQFFSQTDLVSSQVPWMVAMGNHDMEPLYSPDGYGGNVRRFAFPGNGPTNCPVVYSFIYGNVGVLSLDANDVSFDTTANHGYSGGAQTRWLAQRLKFLREQPDVDFIVAYFHYCVYSTCTSHYSDGGVRQAWLSLFDQYKVDLVINGHNHVYERNDPLRGGRPVRKAPTGSSYDSAEGTTYIAAGTGGAGFYAFNAPQSYEGNVNNVESIKSQYVANIDGQLEPQTVTWSRTRYAGYGFLAVDVQPARKGQATTMTVRAVSEQGAELDRVTLRRTAGEVSAATRGVSRAVPDLSAT